jgi:predicted phage-related endonuclease
MGSQPKGISASRGAAILGLSEFATPFEIWQIICEEREPGFNEKKGFALPVREETAAMRFGNAFESAVIELAEREQGEIFCL